MSVELNHTIVHVADKQLSASFVTEILGLPEPKVFGPFLVVEMANGVSLDFADDHGPAVPQHYAFLISDEEFESTFGRIKARGLDYWADPFKNEKGKINRRDGGRGCYFHEPSGHFLEILTVPYGGFSNR
jgi:catechol 2,3-dioxygenase-like lactoylglutathione lyase family enzyme